MPETSYFALLAALKASYHAKWHMIDRPSWRCRGEHANVRSCPRACTIGCTCTYLRPNQSATLVVWNVNVKSRIRLSICNHMQKRGRWFQLDKMIHVMYVRTYPSTPRGQNSIAGFLLEKRWQFWSSKQSAPLMNTQCFRRVIACSCSPTGGSNDGLIT